MSKVTDLMARRAIMNSKDRELAADALYQLIKDEVLPANSPGSLARLNNVFGKE